VRDRLSARAWGAQPDRAVGGLLVLLTLIVFFPTLEHPFVAYDDVADILEHPQVRAGLTLESAAQAFTTPVGAHWYPLTVLSLQLDRELWGDRAAGYHLTNLVLHELAVLVLFAALARMTGAVGRSAFVAAVFAIHPLHVESVAWAVERKDVLSGLFWMLGLLAYARYAERPGARRYLAVLLCLALGLLAKPMLVTFPCVLLLLDWWPLGRLRGGAARRLPDARRLARALLEKLPLFALAAAVAAITLATQRVAAGHLPGLSLGLRVANAIHATGVYLVQGFWPTGLAVFYPHPLAAIPVAEVAASALALAAVTLAALAAAPSRPYLLVGWLWYLGTLVPVSGLVQVGLQARADRYTYIPLIGVAIAVAWGAADIARGRRAALAGCGLAAVAALAAVASAQVSHWRDSRALFEHALAVTEGNHVVHALLARELLAQGRVDAAERHAREAVRLGPQIVTNQLALIEVLRRQGAESELVERYRAVLELEPELPGVELIHHELGFALLRAERYAEARPHLERTLAGNPDLPHVHVGLALVAEAAGRPDDAVREYREALARVPNLRFAANNLARILATCDGAGPCDPPEAVSVAEAALRARREPDPVLLATLAFAYRAAGRPADAERAAAQAADAPGGPPAADRHPLGVLFRDLGVGIVAGADQSR
jgi:tetratricopeptide (TPR) repeat protein